MQAGVEQGGGRFGRRRTISVDAGRKTQKIQRLVGNATSLEGTSDAQNTSFMFQEYVWGQPDFAQTVFVRKAIHRASRW